jgi:hypothetical protein
LRARLRAAGRDDIGSSGEYPVGLEVSNDNSVRNIHPLGLAVIRLLAATLQRPLITEHGEAFPERPGRESPYRFDRGRWRCQSSQ